MTTLAPLYENPEKKEKTLQKVGERPFRIKKIGKWDDESFRLYSHEAFDTVDPTNMQQVCHIWSKKYS